MNDSNILVYMIEYKNIPIGIIQYQKVNNDNKRLYKIDSNNSYEIDIFIWDINYHNIGMGSRCINILSNYLFNNKDTSILIMSPLKSNNHAISCYKKCGFMIKDYYKCLNTIDVLQKYVLMMKEK